MVASTNWLIRKVFTDEAIRAQFELLIEQKRLSDAEKFLNFQGYLNPLEQHNMTLSQFVETYSTISATA